MQLSKETLMKDQKLLRQLTHNQGMMRKIELVISLSNYNHLMISSHRLKKSNMEEAIISNFRCHSETQRIGDEGDATPQFVTDLLKNRITALENELSQKDAIIDFLTKRLDISTRASLIVMLIQ